MGGELQRQDDMAACQQVGLFCHRSTVEESVLHTAEKGAKQGCRAGIITGKSVFQDTYQW